MRRSPPRRPGGKPPSWSRVVTVYVVAGLVWIAASDVVLFVAIDDGFTGSLIKGGLFVLVTAGLLAVLLRAQQQRLDRRAQLLDERDRAVAARTSEVALLDELSDDLVFRYVYEPEPHFAFVSAAATRLVGYSPQDHYDDALLGYRIVHPDDRHLLGEPTAMDRPMRLRCRHRGGRLVWTELRATLETVDGRPVSLVGSARDVTDEVLLSATSAFASRFDADVADDRPLHEALTSLGRDLAESTSAAKVTIGVADPHIAPISIDGDPSSGDDPASAADPSSGDDAASAADPVSATDDEGRSAVIGRSGDTVVEVILTTASPARRSVSAMLPPLAERIAGAVERSRHSFELHRLDRALRATGSAVLLADRDGAIEWVNPAFTDITGYSLDEARGSTPRIVKSGRQSPDFYDGLWATIGAGRSFAARIVNRRKDGSHYVAQVTIDPVRRGDGEVVGFVGVQKDVTDDENRRAKLRERELAALERERGLIRDRSLLVQLLSHELRTPLTVVVGSARTLQRPELDAGTRRRLLDALTRATDDVLDRLGALIAATDDLGGKVETLALEELVRSLTGSLRPRFDADRVRIDGAARWTGDAVVAQAVLRPIVENALKFSPPDQPVDIRVSPADDGAVRVAISDRGAGIDPAVVHRVEQPFQQQDATTTRERGGLGLGLYVARRAADRLGAKVEIDSTSAGTTVVVQLPPTPGSVPAIKPVGSIAPRP